MPRFGLLLGLLLLVGSANSARSQFRDPQLQYGPVSSLTSTLRDTNTVSHDTTLDALTIAPAQGQISWTKFGIGAGALAVGVFGLHVYQANAWWNGQRAPFHVFDDPDYKANFDKAGHTFGAFYSAHFFDEAFTWSGMDTIQSAAVASTLAALWELYIEIEDGFAKYWGFSTGDAKADLAGASFYFLRKAVPGLSNLTYKWAYFPSRQMLESRPDIPGQSLTVI